MGRTRAATARRNVDLPPRRGAGGRLAVCGLLCLALLCPSGGAVAAEPEEVAIPAGGLTLRGFIFKPAGEGPFPAVLYNHGSERLPGAKPAIGAFFSGKGYVLFVPHRRGQGRSQSQGPYIMDELRAVSGPFRDAKLVELQEAQQADVRAALSYLRRLPYVDGSRIAVAGCSFGGIQTLLAAEQDLGLRAAVAFAPAAMTWAGSPSLRARLIESVRKATVPVLFVQALNDYDLDPTRVLAAEMDRAGKPHKSALLPAFGRTPREGHGEFCNSGVETWGAEVLSFLEATMKKAPG